MGTIGGNLAQLHRCWYFRKPENRFNCIRKGGTTCYAMAGDNRYHSIFGAVNKCIAVHPSDVAPALIALNAKIVTTARTIEAENFFDVKIASNTVLAPGEIITEIQVPTPPAGAKSAFLKFAIRKSIDFPIVNCAVMVGGGAPRIALNAVAPKPYRAVKAEAAIAGKPINEANAEAAGAAAVADAKPLAATKYKVQIAKTLVKRALLADGLKELSATDFTDFTEYILIREIRGAFLLPLVNGESFFAEADGFWGYFDQFVVINDFERLLERKIPERHKPDCLVGG